MWRYRFQNPSQDELMHFGIIGQRWGVRRFQNLDRSYTEEGKIRYGRASSNQPAKGLFSKKNINEVNRKQIKKDFDATIKDRKVHADFLKEKNNELTQKQDALMTKYSDYLNKQKLSDEDRESIWNEIHQTAKDYDPYEEKDFFYDDVTSALETNVHKIIHNAPDSYKKEAEKLESEIESFRNQVRNIVKPIIDKYEEKYIKDIDFDDGGYLPAHYAIDDFMKSEFRSPYLYPSLYPSSSDAVDRLVLNNKYFNYTIANYINNIGEEFSLEEYDRRYGT